MTPGDIDRVFGRGRLRMVTGDHVEVFREASLPGERRRYTKRFLATAAGDFREWTEREWRILARLVGHGVRAVPQVVQFDRGAADRPALVQTYDAGVTVDHWATLLPLERDDTRLRNVFEDCAHWWALARHCLLALDSIHALQLVHLDLKADNVCIPIAPAGFDPHARGDALHARFEDLVLIDFAFSLVSGEPLESALPIARQADYEYQSPRLLRALDAGRTGNLAPTRQLDWRCDLFSLAAMLWRYLPELDDSTVGAWTRGRHAKARALVRRLVEAHDAELPALRPHGEFIALASEALEQAELRESLLRGWRLTVDGHVAAPASPTPVTRIALPVAAAVATGAQVAAAVAPPTSESMAEIGVESAGAAPWFFGTSEPEPIRVDPTDIDARALMRGHQQQRRGRRVAWAGGLALAAAAVASVPLFAPHWLTLPGVRADDRQVALAPAVAPTRARVEAAKGAPPQMAPARSEAAPIAPSQGDASSSPTHARVETPEPATTATAPAQATKIESAAKDPASTRTVERAAQPFPAVRPAVRPPVLARDTARPASNGAARPFGSTAAAPAKTLLARAGARSRPQLALAPSVPAARRPGAARTWQDPAAPIPWAVAGRAAPRGAASATMIARAPTTPTRAAAAAPQPIAAAATMQIAARGTTAGAASPSAATTPSTTPAAPTSTTTTAAATTATGAAGTPVNVAAVARELAAGPTPFPGSRPRDQDSTAPTAAAADAPVDFVARANELMTHHVPRLAQAAERTVARVLFVAARSDHVFDDDEIRANAVAVARAPADPLAGMTLLPRDAQQLNSAARAEYARRGSTPEALMLQVRAFGANPLDPEIAGHLAFLLLRQHPAQPEAARQLALHALTLRGARNPEGRIEDWATLAIASALSGRERDARNALLVTLALAPDVERQCKAALDVVALYGERLRGPVEAMLQSAHASPRGQQSPLCEWPPHWVVSGAR